MAASVVTILKYAEERQTTSPPAIPKGEQPTQPPSQDAVATPPEEPSKMPRFFSFDKIKSLTGIGTDIGAMAVSAIAILEYRERRKATSTPAIPKVEPPNRPPSQDAVATPSAEPSSAAAPKR
ncbi:hypothetical protein N7466_002677 [Penicillium verhagenii]|uniref:uncharacterized protein n=1 Tax=Penicillium verhagenii TaxID=1562060 RepID=UPI002545AD74|nr:uncharacterized protein N7466_002677 [Penicillium verhagenii]KAJ5939543.1 hypothetical protein N7466_002677 [Penicillium verhagenii]